MIHRTDPAWQPNINVNTDAGIIARDLPSFYDASLSWQQHLQALITNPKELLFLLEINSSYYDAAMAASRLFPLKVPRTLLDRIERGNINDPILQQILPIAAELNVASGFSTDPVSEQHNQPAGIIHKYHGRVLLMVNGHCAINCRYCFRRHYPYNDNRLNRTQWEKAINVIRQDTSIREIIYSGGDPLASSDKQLHWLTQKIAEIPHITRLRIHTRLPIVIPQRITPDTLAWMTQTRLSTIMVLHCNHANELKDDTLISAIQTMKSAGITLLNQAVLLKNVNDNLGSLIDLSERLFHTGVLPYYLHLLDKVQGAAHFDIDETRAKNLHTELTHHHSGYLVPKLVREVANHPSKISL